MTKFRWLTLKNRVSTEEARRYSETIGCSVQAAKSNLEDNIGPILQHFQEDDGFPDGGYWEDVPSVTQFRGDIND